MDKKERKKLRGDREIEARNEDNIVGVLEEDGKNNENIAEHYNDNEEGEEEEEEEVKDIDDHRYSNHDLKKDYARGNKLFRVRTSKINNHDDVDDDDDDDDDDGNEASLEQLPPITTFPNPQRVSTYVSMTQEHTGESNNGSGIDLANATTTTTINTDTSSSQESLSVGSNQSSKGKSNDLLDKMKLNDVNVDQPVSDILC